MGEQIEIVLVYVFLSRKDAECQSAEGFVGIHAGNHGEKGGEEACFCRGVGAWRTDYGEQANGKRGKGGRAYYVQTHSGLHQCEAQRVAGGGDQSAPGQSACRHPAYSGEAYGGYG